jgi:hypothetical protein
MSTETLKGDLSILVKDIDVKDIDKKPGQLMAPDFFRAVCAEFIGTALFVYLGTGSAFASTAAGPAGSIVGIALAFGLAISVMVCVLAD